MIQKLKKFIFQDVKNENETKKVSVILRLTSLTMCFYFLILFCTFLLFEEKRAAYLCVPCVLAYALVFCTTYMDKTKQAALFAQAVTIGWILVFVRQFGWDCGVQHFVFLLLALNFAISYSRLGYKIVLGVGFCILRLALYAYTSYTAPIHVFSQDMSIIFQTINTVFIFSGIIMILSVLTQDSQEMEKKLVGYNEKLHRLASVDPLTGLLNRRSMQEYLRKKEEECRDGRIDNLSLAIGDIDFFKKINDTYGHECGDVVLRRLAAVFRESVGDKGKISRWGGEEFLFAFDNINGDEALIALDGLQKELRKLETAYNEERVKITMTFGLSEFDFHRGMQYSINDVDEKLYRGKNTGRDKIVY